DRTSQEKRKKSGAEEKIHNGCVFGPPVRPVRLQTPGPGLEELHTKMASAVDTPDYAVSQPHPHHADEMTTRHEERDGLMNEIWALSSYEEPGQGDTGQQTPAKPRLLHQ
ncbi:Protein archease, partial [Frankliniella fusca]